jgi:hypothetical protein
MTIERDASIQIELSVRTLRRWATEHPEVPLLIKNGKALAGPEVIKALAGRKDGELLHS